MIEMRLSDEGSEAPVSDPFARISLETGTRSRARSLVIALLLLGYTKIRWRPDPRGVFTAFDEHRIATVIVVDVSPLSEGYPVPRLSQARAKGMHGLCIEYLQDHVRTKKVRVDYIALPDTHSIEGSLTLTQRKGVAWAFAKERNGNDSWHEEACVRRLGE